MTLSFIQAKTSEQRRMFEELRHVIFGIEQGDTRYAIEDRYQRDMLDDGESEVFLALDVAGSCIGGLRFTNRARQEFIADSAYGFDVLALKLSITQSELIESLWLLDRVCVMDSWRGQGVFKGLLRNALKILSSGRSIVVVTAVKDDNKISCEVFNRLQFEIYDTPYEQGSTKFLKHYRVFECDE